MSEVPSCPRCATSLEPLDIGEVQTDSCPGCGGVLVDQRDLVRVLEIFAAALVRFFDADAAVERLDDPWGQAACPDCARTMAKNGYQGSPNVMIDRCGDCGVVWIDGGELDVMAQLHLRSEHSFQSNVDRIRELAEYLRPAQHFGDVESWRGLDVWAGRKGRATGDFSQQSRHRYATRAPGSRLGHLVVALLDD